MITDTHNQLFHSTVYDELCGPTHTCLSYVSLVKIF